MSRSNQYGGYTTPRPYAYGGTFGNSGLGQNTYIYNNYYGSPGGYGGYGGYGNRGGGGSGFLTNALFGIGGYQLGRMSSGSSYYGGSRYYDDEHRRRSWSESDERSWRATTQAPYFENKVPGSESYLPASAVVGELKFSKFSFFFSIRHCVLSFLI